MIESTTDPASTLPACVSGARRLKVAHVVLSLAPGGLERLVCELSGATVAAGLEVVVCCLDEQGALAEAVQRRGIRVEIVRRRKGLHPGLILELARFFRREGVDVVHTHGGDPMFYGGWAARFAGVPMTIHTQHDTMLADAGWRDRLKFRLACPAFRYLVAVSEKTREIAATHYEAPARLLTIQNGIDEHKFTPAGEVSRRRVADPRGCVIGTVSRLAPEKGLDRLVDAFAALAADAPECRLVIVGDGPEGPRLADQVKRLRLTELVTLAGHTSDVESALRDFDIYVLPSITEGIPLALLEAMGAGLPVVASAVGGVPEVIDQGVSGVLVPADDRAALRAAIEALVRSPERRAELGREARKRIRARFSLAAMAAAYHELYRQDLAERRWLRPFKRAAQLAFPRRLVAWRGRADRAEAALTIDDGPDAEFTPRLLEILAAHRVRGTFFLIGEKVIRYPEIARQIVDAGHEVGSHSFTHPQFSDLSWREAVEEVTSTRRVLPVSPGPTTRLFRPPHGAVTAGSTVAPWLHGETVVLWNVDYKDFMAEESTDITAKVNRRGVTAGDIILYHGKNRAALEALPAILESGRRNGVSFVPVSRLLEA